MVSQKPKIAKALREIVTGENYLWQWCKSVTVTLLQNQNSFFIFFVYIFIHISANMSPSGLKFSQMILHTGTSKLMYNWSFLFVVFHKQTLLSSTFKYTGWPRKNGTVNTVAFSGLCSDQLLFFSPCWIEHLASHYINTKIIKFGWELFILWVISYGLSSSGFARFSWISKHDDKLMANPENDSP